MMDKVVLGQVFSECCGFPCQSLFHQLLNSHHHLPFGAGTINRPVVATVSSGFGLTPLLLLLLLLLPIIIQFNSIQFIYVQT
jgi:hypothetical protein